MKTQASYASFKTSGGAKVHRLPLQAFPNFWVYAYVVQSDRSNYLIDAGSGTDTSHEYLLSGLQQAGLQPSDLTYIILTHAHIDHYGGLTKLRSLTDAKIGCHELDIQTISDSDSQTELMERRLASFLTYAGLAKETVDQLLDIYRFTKSLYRSVPVDITYEAAGMKIGPLEMIHLPGHCAGHVAMRVDDIVLCGDMVVEGVTPHLNPESISSHNGLSLYLDSLHKLLTWTKDARLILNGHDEAFKNLSERVTATHKNLIRRMSNAVDALKESLTIAELAEAVYGDMDGYQKLLILEKTGAYIEYFLQHNMLEITDPDYIPARYRRVRDFSDEELLSIRNHGTVHAA